MATTRTTEPGTGVAPSREPIALAYGPAGVRLRTGRVYKIKISRPGTLEVVFFDSEDRPRAGALIELELRLETDEGGLEAFEQTTGDDGRARFPGLGKGSYQVEVLHYPVAAQEGGERPKGKIRETSLEFSSDPGVLAHDGSTTTTLEIRVRPRFAQLKERLASRIKRALSSLALIAPQRQEKTLDQVRFQDMSSRKPLAQCFAYLDDKTAPAPFSASIAGYLDGEGVLRTLRGEADDEPECGPPVQLVGGRSYRLCLAECALSDAAELDERALETVRAAPLVSIRLGSLTVLFVDSARQPIQGIQVGLERTDAGFQATELRTQTSNQAGTIAFEGLVRGSYALELLEVPLKRGEGARAHRRCWTHVQAPMPLDELFLCDALSITVQVHNLRDTVRSLTNVIKAGLAPIAKLMSKLRA